MSKTIKKLISTVAIAAVVLAGSMFITTAPVKAQTQAYQMVMHGSTGVYTDTDGVEHSIEFQPWSLQDAIPTGSGNYFLMGDVVLRNVRLDSDACINLCLNGKTITIEDNSSAKAGILLENKNVILNIYDTVGGTIRLSDNSSINNILCVGSGTVNLYGGTITNGPTGVKVDTEGTFNMYGGSISQNGHMDTRYVKAGVSNWGTFNMYGGTISDNSNYGVISEGDFYLYGGSIVGNITGSRQIDVLVRGSNFVRSGGEIGVFEYSRRSVYRWSNKIEFNPNGGSGTMYDAYVWQDVNGGYGRITLPPNAYEKEGQRFLSWNTKADGSGVSFADGAVFTGADAGGDMTLYAQWEDFPALGGTNENADSNANNLGASTTPQTGDSSTLITYIVIDALAAGAGLAMTFKKANFEK
ncbi:MAG: LPXTG cell wall anchor domain-containing protein [Lachnospiraceae bacterium]|nr:LPXTG cell wall anchor domain-containing protein [Lachnospiraceae bacterium]